MSLSGEDKKSFEMLEKKLKCVNSDDKITEFIQFIKDNEFSSYLIKTGSCYRNHSIMSMALSHGFEPLIKRLMMEQFSIVHYDSIYNIEKLIKYFHLYDNSNQNNAIRAMVTQTCNKCMKYNYKKKIVIKMFNDLKHMFDLNQMSIKDIRINDDLFSFIIDITGSTPINLKENVFLIDIVQQGIKNNVKPKSKPQLNILKKRGFFDMYADHIKKQLLIAELLSDGEELIITDTINSDIDAGINII